MVNIPLTINQNITLGITNNGDLTVTTIITDPVVADKLIAALTEWATAKRSAPTLTFNMLAVGSGFKFQQSPEPRPTYTKLSMSTYGVVGGAPITAVPAIYNTAVEKV